MRFTLIGLLLSTILSAQIQPGFDTDEYIEMMLISARNASDTSYTNQFPEPASHVRIYQSDSMGLDNQWDLWYDALNKTAVLSIRGTTKHLDSWILNLYAAMIPAKGTVSWGMEDEREQFDYHFADHPNASVHAGWTLGTVFLMKDMIPKIQALYDTAQITNFYVVGHSQGGAIAYLVTAQLMHLKETGELPLNMVFKTYASAAPKPGNLYFAYDYESRIQNGWAFNVVNAADWVPEVPFSIQTLDDFNHINPFNFVDEMIAQQGFLDRIGLWWVYRKLDKPTREAQKSFEEYLGNKTGRVVADKIPGLQMPDYVSTNNYVRTGMTIVLQPDSAYRVAFPEDSTKVFMHHFHQPYIFLAQRLNKPFYNSETEPTLSELIIGEKWVVTNMYSSESERMEEFDDQDVYFVFGESKWVAGQSYCNTFGVSYMLVDDRLTIYRDLLRTLLYCNQMEYEDLMIHNLHRCSQVSLDDNILTLSNGDIPLIVAKRWE